MSAATLFGLLLAALAVGYVVAPLIWPQAFGVGRAAPSAPADPIDELTGLRDQVLGQIVALDFEQAVGKTDEEEYQVERLALKRKALAVIRSLDEQVQAESLEDTIEQEVRRVRAARTPVAPLAADVDLDAEIERQVIALRQARGAAQSE